MQFDKGEGGAGLNALVALDDSGYLTTRLGCRKRKGKLEVQLGLYCRQSGELPKELKPICENSNDDATLNMSVCINGRCEDRKWRFLASGFGDAFFTDEAVQSPFDSLESLRIIVPNESRRYEFRGKLGAALRKICR